MKRIFMWSCMLTLLSLNSVAHSAGEAMFGLKWKDSSDAVKRSGVQMTLEKQEGNLEVYKSTSLPKNTNDAEVYTLVFDKTLGLVKLNMISKDIANDPYGIEGKERFAALAALLAGKYKENHQVSMTRTGMKLWQEPDEFYQCLAYPGCGMWVRTFDDDNKNIVLELKGLRRGEGYIVITSEAVPEWAEALEGQKGVRKRQEAEAL